MCQIHWSQWVRWCIAPNLTNSYFSSTVSGWPAGLNASMWPSKNYERNFTHFNDFIILSWIPPRKTVILANRGWKLQVLRSNILDINYHEFLLHELSERPSWGMTWRMWIRRPLLKAVAIILSNRIII